MEDDASCTVTFATGACVTVMFADAILPSEVAVIVADPTATPVTTPVVTFTVAMVLAELVQATARPVSVVPAGSLVTALSVSVCPTATDPDVGVTSTVFTGAGPTVTTA